MLLQAPKQLQEDSKRHAGAQPHVGASDIVSLKSHAPSVKEKKASVIPKEVAF